MEEPIKLWQLIAATVLALMPYLIQLYNGRTTAQEKRRKELQEEREKERQEKEKERKAAEDAEETTWKRVVSEYERALQRAHKLEQENEQLRPLALQNAVLEQKMSQCKEDKEDWKSHAERLEQQLKENNIIPLPFKRNPREDTGESLKTISRKMKAIKENHMPPMELEHPTLIFPPIQGSGKGAKQE